MMKKSTDRPQEGLKSMGGVLSFAIFGCAALLLMVETYFLIPYLSVNTGQEPVLFWFIVAGLGLFFPIIIVAQFILRSEGYNMQRHTWRERLRFKPLTRIDWFWSLGALVLIGVLSALIMKGLELTLGAFDHSPPFMAFKPVTPGRYWLLAVWFPYWVLNILGEEILWRGVMLPRQEAKWGCFAWLIHAIGWGLFHLAFGWQLLITLLPILLILPYTVQKRQNSWVGVIIHAGLNGPSFLAIAFGLI